MPKFKWLTEIVSTTTKIFINPGRYTLAKEIAKNLQNYSSVQVVGESDDYDIAIYLAGFEKPTWSETVQYTSALHKALDATLNRRAKFVLVTPSTATQFGGVARSTLEQFGKTFGLSYLIIETGNIVDASDSGEAIVKAFIKAPPTVKKTPSPIPLADVKTETKEYSWKLIFLSLVILLSPWLLLAILIGATWLGLRCMGWGLASGRSRVSLHCASASAMTANLASPLTVLTPGLTIAEPLAVAAKFGPMLSSADQVATVLAPYLQILSHPANAPEFPQAGELTTQVSTLSQLVNDLDSQLQTSEVARKMAGNLAGQISTANKLANKLNLIAPALPDLWSVNGQTTWLLLLQDNTEVRPTGGFVDGIGLVSLEKGTIKDIQFLSASAADVQLRGQVEPPAELTQALGEKNWYLRDSNWDPDFPTSAARAAWFVEKELDTQVDGVVAINLNTLRQLLKVVEPVEVPDFGGKLTAENLLTNYLKSVKFDSDQSSLLSQLAQAIYEKSQSLSAGQLRQMAQIGLAGLEARQILIWPITKPIPAVAQVGWTGQLKPTPCSSTYPCVEQMAYLVDSNVGINKVDPFIKRNLGILTKVEPTHITTSYAWQYTHSGTTSGWPGGDYKDFVRIYLPPATKIEQVMVNGQDITGKQLPQTEHGLKKLSLQFTLTPGQTGQIFLKVSSEVPTSPRWHYQQLLPNQPGIAPYSVAFEVNYPTDWWVTTSLAPQIASKGHFRYNSSTSGYLKWNMDWVPTAN